jgi:hypothetical protein
MMAAMLHFFSRHANFVPQRGRDEDDRAAQREAPRLRCREGGDGELAGRLDEGQRLEQLPFLAFPPLRRDDR